jgi:hypothetical protein
VPRSARGPVNAPGRVRVLGYVLLGKIRLSKVRLSYTVLGCIIKCCYNENTFSQVPLNFTSANC